MAWHFFAGYGMMPFGIQTDPCMKVFCTEVKAAIPEINIHDSPYRDFQVNQIAAIIGELPETDGVFVAGTSLMANNVPVVCSRTHHNIDGAFGFQASLYGVHQPFTANVKFAHLISSDNPLPFPGLGAYRWERGAMTGGLILQVHNIPHPGDYDAHDRATFIHEMKTIIAHSSRPSLIVADRLSAASQAEYTFVANGLVAFARRWISTLPTWQQQFIPMDKIPAAAGATAKEAVDLIDEYRGSHAPPPAPLAAKMKRNRRRRRK